jgi:PKD repeat protein
VDELSFNFHLRLSSPARDGGDPGQDFLDPDGTGNDIGADGGPNGVTDYLLPVPVIAVEPSPAFGDPPFTVLVDGSGSNDEWGISSYSWDFDALDGFQEDATGPEVQHTYTQDGTYTVTLQVTDNNNLVNSATTEVVVGQPPTVNVTALPAAGAVPLIVQFTTDAFDPDGGQLMYSWDFTAGGQIDSTSADSEYTYLDDGGYVPGVTVSDDEGAITRATLPVTGTVWPVQAAEHVDELAS